MMKAKIAGISAVIAVATGLLIPEGILTGHETITTVLAVWIMCCGAAEYALEVRKEILEKRRGLNCKAHRPDRGNRDSLHTDIVIRKRWPIIIPAEKVED